MTTTTPEPGTLPRKEKTMQTTVSPRRTTPFNRLGPIGIAAASLDDPFWTARLQANRETSLREGYDRLEEYGALALLRAAAAGDPPPEMKPFNSPHFYRLLDSDVYKWLEALSYEHLRRPLGDELRASADELVDLIGRAQRPSGYIHTWVTVHGDDESLDDWATSFVPYCAAHLMQAGVAFSRAFGDDRLLAVASGMADYLADVHRRHPEFVPLHPGLEMALVELFRETDESRHLDLATALIDGRGFDRIGWWKFTPDRYVDDIPLREAFRIRGHSVMALYLLCGMVDVAVETDDAALLAAAEAQWEDFVGSKMYITGGAGSMHHDEAFGRPFELSPDTAYAETCAAVSSVMLSWRLLLATGKARYAELIERTVYNGLLSGASLDGTEYFYVNPLYVREAGRVLSPDGYFHRKAWYECACCPPNLMRSLSTFQQLCYTSDASGIQVHQFVSGELVADPAARRLSVKSGVPFADGEVVIRVHETDGDEWTLSVRIPEWADRPSFELSWENGESEAVPDDAGYLRLHRAWSAGDAVTLRFHPGFAAVAADPRIDAYRGQRAIVRGPLVWCVEGDDLPEGLELDRVQLSGPAEPCDGADEALPFVPLATVALAAVESNPIDRNEPGAPPYGRFTSSAPGRDSTGRLVPYFAWGNRGPTTMRVWLPISEDFSSVTKGRR